MRALLLAVASGTLVTAILLAAGPLLVRANGHGRRRLRFLLFSTVATVVWSKPTAKSARRRPHRPRSSGRGEAPLEIQEHGNCVTDFREGERADIAQLLAETGDGDSPEVLAFCR